MRRIPFAGIELTSQRVRGYMVPLSYRGDRLSAYSRCPGLPASSLPVCPVYRCFFFVPPRHPGLPVVCRYTGVVHFFMLAELLLLLHTPTHAAAHNTTQHAGCCGQQPTLAYTPCHVRQENSFHSCEVLQTSRAGRHQSNVFYDS